MERLDPAFKIPEVWLRYDASAATQITRFDGDACRLPHLRHDVTSAPHQMGPRRNVLVIGPGGGRDILTALHFGSGRVTGVEINPITIELLRGQFRDFSGGLYDGFPGVTVINDEGRSFVRHASEQYDLIQASLVDTWAASSAGAHALTENNLYTVEAFEDYLRRLTPDGVVAFSRWFGQPALARVGRKRAALWALYFAGLGLGFIMVEIVLIQRFSLFLGYPVYSLSVVLFTVLLAGAVGSFLAEKWSRDRALPRILALLCGVLALYALTLPRLLNATLSASTPVRIVLAVLVVAPLGLLMGMPFPTGLRRAGREANGLVSWAWAVNGGASVFGSTLTVLISMTYGFTASFLAGAGAYALALGVAVWMSRPRLTAEATPIPILEKAVM